jgi:hypothetical protein
MALPWLDELLTCTALGERFVLPGFRRAHAQLHRVIVHASLMAARRAFDRTLAFLIRVRVEHPYVSKTVRLAARVPPQRVLGLGDDVQVVWPQPER